LILQLGTSTIIEVIFEMTNQMDSTELKRIAVLSRIIKTRVQKKTSRPIKERWDPLQTLFTSSLKVFLTLLLLIIISHAIYELFRYDIVIKPFETPFNLAREEGYTGIVVAYRLQDAMNEIREHINRSSMRGAVPWVAAAQLTELQNHHDIDVPTVGLSLNTISYQLRKLLGIKQRIISGDMVIKNNQVHMTLRISGKPTFKVKVTEDVDDAIIAAAEQILKTLEPLNFGLYYYINNKPAQLESLIKQVRQSEFSLKQKLISSEEAVALTLEGCLLSLQKQLNEALSKFSQAQQLAPHIRVIYRMKGDTLLNLEQFEPAIAEYAAALKLDSKLGGGIYTQWARALIKSGKIQQGFAKYEQASQQDTDNPWVYTDWGYHLAVELNQFEAAYKKFKKAVQLNPNYALTYAHWGDILLKEGRLEEARNKYEKASQKYEQAIQLEPSVAWIYGNWGFALSQLGKHEQAIALYEKAEKLEHHLSWIYKNWGYALLGVKQYDQADLKFQKAVELEPNNPRWFYEWGKAFSQLSEYQSAVDRYQQALKIAPNHIWSHIRLGHALMRLQKPADVLPECQAVLQSPTASDKAQAAAYALCGLAKVRLNQLSEGIKDCQKALQLYEKEDWAYWCLADALVAQKPAEAVIQYQKAVQLKPENAFYRYQWAKVLVQLEQDEAALMQYQKAVELDKEGEIGKKAQAAIANLQS
jgi:tetratricopeptide (TPR) repeat protein